MENRSEQRRRAVLEALARAMEPLIAVRAKENQKVRKGNQPGATCQKSDRLIDDTFHKGKVALNHGSNPTRASPGTPTLGGQGLRTTNVATHESQKGDRAL